MPSPLKSQKMKKRNIVKNNKNWEKIWKISYEPMQAIYCTYFTIILSIMPKPHAWKILNETSLYIPSKWTYINEQYMN